MNGAQFRGENENYAQALMLSLKPQIWSFHVVVLLTTAKKWTKMKRCSCKAVAFAH